MINKKYKLSEIQNQKEKQIKIVIYNKNIEN